MVWVNGCPKFLIDLPINEDIIDIAHIYHTPLLTVLTKSGVFVFHQHTLLPLASHVRNTQLIETNGYNIQMKTKHVSVNTAKLQKLSIVNLFIQSENNFLIIYQISINYSGSIYEVHNKNDELIQNGLPLSSTSLGFSVTDFFKSATKSIIHGTEEVSVNLENIENINNGTIEDEIGGFEIEPIKLSIFKILKIGIGLKDFWLQENSHTLFVFNNHDEKTPDNEDDFFQIINVLNFKNKLFSLLEFTWYDSNSRIKYITYNEYFDYFIFVNKKNEIWIMHLGNDQEDMGYKIGTGDIDNISFNPQCHLLIAKDNTSAGGTLNTYMLKNNNLQFLKNLNLNGEIKWSPCGQFFTLLEASGSWKLLSKFGSISFDSQEILNEFDELNDPNRDFLKANIIVISQNASTLYVVTDKKIFYTPLMRANGGLLYDHEYISVIQSDKRLLRFPILAKYKKIILDRGHFNGRIHKNLSNQTGKLCLDKNSHNQLSISYGDYLAVSTPYSQGDLIYHVLWFNFKNFFADSLNIIHHFWFQDFLIVVNRRSRHTFEENEEVDDVNGNGDYLVDEFMVLDASKTKYGMGGEEISFTSDSLMWKYDFKSTFIDINLSEPTKGKSQVVILTADHRLIVLDLSTNRLIKSDTDIKHYKIFISVNKTVNLSTINAKIELNQVVQTSMINNRHFLFLLATGDIYLLKNQSRETSSSLSSLRTPIEAMKPSNMYDLVKLHSNIEFFKFKSIKFENDIEFVYLFNGQEILVYEVSELIEKSYNDNDREEKPEDVLEFKEEEEENLLPICIHTDGMQPFEFDAVFNHKSLDLIGLNTLAINKPKSGGLFIRNTVSRKLILNNFIEFDLLHKGDLESSFKKYENFKNFHYCLELLLFKHLTNDDYLPLKRLFQLIEFTENSERIYINCLRKIEIGYWHRFFSALETTPEKFMKRLIAIDNVELCYNYLIIYLNYKNEGDTETDELNDHDKEVILKIIKMLESSSKWDWCFELCRFIKILEPSGDFLRQIKQELE